MYMKKEIIFIVVFFQIHETISQTTNCSINQVVGLNTSSGNTYDNDKGVVIMMAHDDYQYQCCGFIYKWEFHVDSSYPLTGFFYGQVWRDVGTVSSGVNAFSATLVGSNYLTAYKHGYDSQTIANGDRIRCKFNDYMGIHSIGSFPLITINAGNGHNRLKLSGQTTNLTSPYEWKGYDNSKADFTINSHVTPSKTPTINSISDFTYYNDELYIGRRIVTVKMTDGDIEDQNFLTLTLDSITNSGNNYYQIVPKDNFTVKAVPPVKNYTVTLKVEDLCNQSSISSFTIYVLNRPPIINNLPKTINISEDTAGNALIFNINATDTVTDPLNCSAIGGNTNNFTVKTISPSTTKGVYTTTGVVFNYDTQIMYTITVQCTDGSDNVNGVLTINLIRNNPPVIYSLPASSNISEDLAVRTLLHTLTVNDTEGDNITCKLNPNSSVFDVSKITGSTNYGIYLTGGTTLDYDTKASYVLQVECADNRRSSNGTYTIYLIRNTPPVIYSLPASTNISEDLAVRTLLHSLFVNDTDGDNITCTLSSNSSIFDVSYIPTNPTKYGIYLTGGTTLDYDTKSSYVIQVQCSDRRRSTSGNYTIYLKRNTPPVIYSLPASTNFSENVAARTLLHNLFVNDTDGDNITCTLNPNSSIFDVSHVSTSITEYGIYLTGGTTLDYYTKSSYIIQVECADRRRSCKGNFTVYLIKNTPPVIYSLPASTNFSEDLAVRTLLHKLLVNDSDSSNFSCALNPTSSIFDVALISTSTTAVVKLLKLAEGSKQVDNSVCPPIKKATIVFLNQTNQEYGIHLTGGTTLDYDTKSSYVLQVECADSRNSSKGNYTINLIRNTPPVIYSLPSSTRFSEDLAVRTLLHNLFVNDTDGDNITCTLNPNSAIFDVSHITTSTTAYGIYLTGGTTLDYDTKSSYVIQVQCADRRRSTSGNYTINLIRNMPPVIYNLPASTSFSEDLAVRVLLHGLFVNDTDGDNITCTLNPNSTIFDVSHIPTSTTEYGIYLTGGTTLDYDTKSSYVLQVECADRRRSTNGNYTVNLIRNTPPDIYSLPASTNFSENLVVRTLLHSLVVNDTDGDTITCTLKSYNTTFDVSHIPPSTSQYGIYLTGGKTLDYNSRSTYVLQVECADHRRSSKPNYTINLIKNQPPVIYSLPSSTSFSEDLAVRTLLHSLFVNDTDSNTFTCILSPTSTIFDVSHIPPSTTEYGIYLTGGTTLDYDTKSSYSLQVKCDDGKANTKGNYTVNLIRNTPPVIYSLPASTSFSEDLAVRTLLHSLFVNDTDGDTITCTLNSTSTIFDVSHIPPSTTDYGIYLTGGTTLDYDTKSSYVIQVACADHRRSTKGNYTINLIRNQPPVITSLPASISFSEDLAVRTLLHTLLVNDTESDTITCTLNPNSSIFDVSLIPTSTTVYGIFLTGGKTLDYVTTPSYMLQVQCADHRRSTKGNYTANLIMNVPPTIQNLPMSCNIPEDTQQETLIYSVSVTDPENDTIVCSIVSNTSLFYIQISGNQFQYDIFVRSYPGFRYDTLRNYMIHISCVDQRRGDSDYFYIYLIRNQPPKFTNLQGKTTVSSTMSRTGQLVFTVLAYDRENDPLQYSMTASKNGPFLIDQNSGKISMTRSVMMESVTGYDLFINVSDGKQTVGPNTLTVLIIDINSPPVFTDLPQTVSLLEGISVGSVVFKPQVNDKNNADVHSFSVSYNPPGGAVYFTINKTDGRITTLADIDYETITYKTFVLTITVTDGFMADTGNLTINILNVNDAPKFTKKSYRFSAAEGIAGTVLQNPYYQCTDPEGDTLMFSFDCGANTGRLNMNKSNGFFSYAVKYDLDVSGTPSNLLCQVNVSDGSYSDTANLNITIIDENDNIPVFQHAEYTFFVRAKTAVGTNIGQVNAKDADVGQYGTFIYHIEQESIAYNIFKVSNNGGVSLITSLTTYPEKSILRFKIYAVDVGGLDSSTNVTIVIPDTSVPPADPEDTRLYKSFFTYAPNMAWFVPAMFIVSVAVCVVVYTIWEAVSERMSINQKDRNESTREFPIPRPRRF